MLITAHANPEGLLGEPTPGLEPTWDSGSVLQMNEPTPMISTKPMIEISTNLTRHDGGPGDVYESVI
jgi:hypothetical protein